MFCFSIRKQINYIKEDFLMKKALKIYISVDMEGMAGITSPSQERDEVPSGKSPFLILMEAERTFLMMNFARWMNVSA